MTRRRLSSLSLNQKLILILMSLGIIVACIGIPVTIINAFFSGHDWFSPQLSPTPATIAQPFMPTAVASATQIDLAATATIDLSLVSPTPDIGNQLVKLVDNYYRCFNVARHDSATDYEKCWNLLSEEYQTNLNNSNNGAGFESFFTYWNSYKLGYALFYCPNNKGHFVDAVYYRYKWNDLSTPDITGKRYIEFSFGLDKNGWRITNGNASAGKLSPDCEEKPRIENWTPLAP